MAAPILLSLTLRPASSEGEAQKGAATVIVANRGTASVIDASAAARAMSKRIYALLTLAATGDALALPRRRFVAACATAALPAQTALAKDLYYTKEDYCKKSDAEIKNGIEFGCEAYVQDPAKRLKMRRRALAALRRASERLDRLENVEMSVAGGARVRETLRKDPLDGLRAQGKRLSTLSDVSEVGLAYDETIKAVEALDLKARRLELDDGAAARDEAAAVLRKAQAALRRLVSVGSEPDLLEPADVAPPAGGA